MQPDAPTVAGRAVLPALIKTNIGTRRADGTVVVSRRERPNLFLYGPYWQLAQGRYRLEFSCTAPRDTQEIFLGVEVLAQNRTFLAIRDYCVAELPDGRGSIVFEVPAALAVESGSGAFFEFRFLSFTVADFALTSVSLAPADTAPEPLPLCWRLASRLLPGVLATAGLTGCVSSQDGSAAASHGASGCPSPWQQEPTGCRCTPRFQPARRWPRSV